MTAGAQRTPASLLLEMCNQNEWEPVYVLTEVKGASHDPTFTYKVTVKDVVAIASGHSKRKAKHFAAKSALEQLLSRPEHSDGFDFENTKVTADNLNEIVLEPSAEPLPMGKDAKNATGELQEFCMKQKMSAPYYEVIDESGPPHDKTFSLRCMVKEFTTYGEGKTKRIAKRVAAESMYEILLKSEYNQPIPEKVKKSYEYHEQPSEETPLSVCEHVEDSGENILFSHTESSETKSDESDLHTEANSDVCLNTQVDGIKNSLNKITADSD